ncbi:PLP-dependent decarboxylase [Cysteiniphilum sp. 6C5]|uniref:PLP-dependent decarboxylase n=1 Tax=unclassified Cysteiniphilum TaxID=2610889 RepID=UPI003F86CA94
MVDTSYHHQALVDLTKEINAPFFFYDLDYLQAHIKTLQTLPVTLWYALKANPLSAIISTLDDGGMRFDVASIGELDQVLKQGVDSARILHTGPAKSYEQLCYFVDQGVNKFVIESTQQLQDVQSIAYEKQIHVEVLLRVQLQWQEGEKNVLGGECVTPFGLSLNDWIAYSKSNDFDCPYLNILGFHCFQWGNILCIDKLERIWFTIADTLHELAETMGIGLRVLDLGGGLGIDYQHEGQELSLSEINTLILKVKSHYPQTEIWLELGRYAVAKCGVYVTEVVDRKTVYERDMLILAGGSQHLMRPTLTSQAFPVSLLRESYTHLSKIHLHGALCTSLDYLGEVQLPNDTKAQDHIIFHSTGAYGFTESMPFFLCHTLPAEVTYQKGEKGKKKQIKILRKAESAGVWLK